MKKEKRKVKGKELVPKIVEKEVDFYITSDGKEFTKEEEAQKHEEYLSIPKKYYDGPYVESGTLFCLNSEDDIHKAGYGWALKNRKMDINKFSFPGWYLIRKEEWDIGYSIYTYSLKEIKEDLLECLNSLPNEEYKFT